MRKNVAPPMVVASATVVSIRFANYLYIRRCFWDARRIHITIICTSGLVGQGIPSRVRGHVSSKVMKKSSFSWTCDVEVAIPLQIAYENQIDTTPSLALIDTPQNFFSSHPRCHRQGKEIFFKFPGDVFPSCCAVAHIFPPHELPAQINNWRCLS